MCPVIYCVSSRGVSGIRLYWHRDKATTIICLAHLFPLDIHGAPPKIVTNPHFFVLYCPIQCRKLLIKFLADCNIETTMFGASPITDSLEPLETFPITTGFAPLTTPFTPPPECSTRWIPANDGQTIIVNHSGRTLSGLAHSDYFDKCNPFSQRYSTYSPGMCPSGHTMGEIKLITRDTSHVWHARCCIRYGNFPIAKKYIFQALTY